MEERKNIFIEDRKCIGIISRYQESLGEGNKRRREGEVVIRNGRSYCLGKEGFKYSKINISNETPIVFSLWTFIPDVLIEDSFAYHWRPVSSKEDFDYVLEETNNDEELEYWGRVVKNYIPFPVNKYGLKNFDILVVSLSQLLTGKNEKSAINYLLHGFNFFLQSNNCNKIAYYYNCVKDAINHSEFKFSQEFFEKESKEIHFHPKEKSENFNIEKYLFKRKVIGLFNSNLYDYQKFKIWQLGEYYVESEKVEPVPEIIFYESPTAKKTPPVFHEKEFIKFRNELRPEDFHRLKFFKFTKNAKKKLIKKFLKKKYDNYFDFVEALFVANSFGMVHELFEHFIKKISNKIFLSLWMKKRILVDYQLKTISLYGNFLPFKKGFLIPESTLLKFTPDITSKEILRIKEDYPNADEIIFRILTLKLEKGALWGDYSYKTDFFQSAKHLNTQTRIRLFDSFVNNQKVDWGVLMAMGILEIHPKKKGSMLDYNFPISDIHEKKILAIETDPPENYLETTLKFKYILSPEYVTQYLIQRINKGDRDTLKFSYLKNFKSNELTEKVFSTWRFESDIKTLELITYCQKNQISLSQEFLNNLKKKIKNFRIIYHIKISMVFPEKFIIDSMFEKLDSFDLNEFLLLEETLIKVFLSEQQKEKLLDLFVRNSSTLRAESILRILDFFIEKNISLNKDYLIKFQSLLEYFQNNQIIEEKIKQLIRKETPKN